MIESWCEALYETWLSTSIRESAWVYPLLHFAHILANTFMFGMIVFVDLRLLGIGFMRRRVTDVTGLIGWAIFGWILMFISGALIFASDPVRYYNSGLFRLKLFLMLLAGINALLFHFTTYRRVRTWDHGRLPARARLTGAISLTSWIAVVIVGRAVGYFG